MPRTVYIHRLGKEGVRISPVSTTICLDEMSQKPESIDTVLDFVCQHLYDNRRYLGDKGLTSDELLNAIGVRDEAKKPWRNNIAVYETNVQCTDDAVCKAILADPKPPNAQFETWMQYVAKDTPLEVRASLTALCADVPRGLQVRSGKLILTEERKKLAPLPWHLFATPEASASVAKVMPERRGAFHYEKYVVLRAAEENAAAKAKRKPKTKESVMSPSSRPTSPLVEQNLAASLGPLDQNALLGVQEALCRDQDTQKAQAHLTQCVAQYAAFMQHHASAQQQALVLEKQVLDAYGYLIARARAVAVNPSPIPQSNSLPPLVSQCFGLN
jgi:hypothetical protein